ncbi:MAG: hypothetical protein ACD_75C02282G0001 [uncultured bacterium]|nr:MAG: hypothetical protein ACD_75C02282G0001 [uncultured bacterium]
MRRLGPHLQLTRIAGNGGGNLLGLHRAGKIDPTLVEGHTREFHLRAGNKALESSFRPEPGLHLGLQPGKAIVSVAEG